nr:MAG TPA: Protein of unknown function (DUF551) [Caudoviricetes sp.]
MAEYLERKAAVMRLMQDGCNAKNVQTIMALPAASVPQWISVKDKLPENGETVLIWYEYFRYGSYNRMFQTHGIGFQYNGQWAGVDPLGHKARVFAWMQLPEPPKGE